MVDRIAPTPPPHLRRLYRIGLAGWFGLIALIDVGAYTGILPTQIRQLPYYDTILHFILVGTFGAMLDGALNHRAIVRVPFVPRIGPGIALALAATEEYLQRMSPRRSSSWSDLAANFTGILVLSWVLKRITITAIEREEAKSKGLEYGPGGPEKAAKDAGEEAS